MTKEEQIRILENHRDWLLDPPAVSGGKCEIIAEAIQGAVHDMRRQIRMQPKKNKFKNFTREVKICPVCEELLIYGYPCKCGQMIDWENKNEL